MKRENILQFICTLKKNDSLMTEFDEELWFATKDSTELP